MKCMRPFREVEPFGAGVFVYFCKIPKVVGMQIGSHLEPVRVTDKVKLEEKVISNCIFCVRGLTLTLYENKGGYDHGKHFRA